MATTEHRLYQTAAHRGLRQAYADGCRAPLLVLPTGGGKTHVAKDVIASAVAKGKEVLFLAPRRELIFQSSEKLTDAGIQHGVLMAGEPYSPTMRVQVASVPTLYTRGLRNERIPMPNASVVVIDEAHLARGDMTMQVLAQYPNAVKIGLTATPARTDGKGLGKIFDRLVMGPSVADLIRQGYLVPPKYFVPSSPDLKGVKVQAGDYNQRELGQRMNDKTLVGDVLTNWLRLASDRKTVIFTVNVAHSLHIEQTFKAAGISIAHLDANTPKDVRAQTLRDLRAGKIQVISNCDILSLGWDEPSISCCVLARPTKSVVRYMQAVGRVLRPYPGKADCLILDHGGCVDEHGLVEDPRDWQLHDEGNVNERSKQQRKDAERKQVTCGGCSHVFRACPACPLCGWQVPQHRRQAMEVIDDDLVQLAEGRRLKREWSQPERQRFYSELLHYAALRGYRDGWAAHKYRERLTTFPRGLNKVPQPPSQETLAWLKHLAIKAAKRREREAKQQGVAT